MWFISQVTKWVDNRDSKIRVDEHDVNQHGYHYYLLNPNRISDMKDLTVLAVLKSSFLFSDNHRDRREGNSYIECLSSPAQIIAAHDTDFHSQFITLPFCPKNNPLKATVDTTIDVDDLAYACAYRAPAELEALGVDENEFCWIVYDRKAFRRVEQLTKLNIWQLEDRGETGSTTTTSTSTTQ
jgi:hypothetical protein